MKPSAILFDLDDTILQCPGGDFLKLWMNSVEEHIHLFDGLSSPDLFKAIRVEADTFWNDPDRHKNGRLDILNTRTGMVFRASENLGSPNQDAAALLADHYHQIREFNVTPFKGAIETVQHFHKSPIKTALITNGGPDTQRHKINQHALEQYFDVILIEGEFGNGKPHPDVYTHICDRLDVPANESWIVGDNLDWEVRVPQTLGFFSIWNDHLGKGLDKDLNITPDAIVENISELIELEASFD